MNEESFSLPQPQGSEQGSTKPQFLLVSHHTTLRRKFKNETNANDLEQKDTNNWILMTGGHRPKHPQVHVTFLVGETIHLLMVCDRFSL